MSTRFWVELWTQRPLRRIGFSLTERVVLRAQLATAGTLLAARLALQEGLACNTAGGSHHARADQGAGFCVFNDVAVAASVLLAEGLVKQISGGGFRCPSWRRYGPDLSR
jgi:acetoin utilization deacetylase AcuC-like enzyme